MADPRPFVQSAALTAVAIGYRNLALIADQALPRIPVPAETYKWTYYPTAELFTVPHTEVGRRGRVERVEFSGQEMSGATRDFGLEDGIPYSDINAAAALRASGVSAYDPEARSTMGLMALVQLDREVRVARLIQDPNNYAPARRLALSGSDQFSDPASDPIKVLKAAQYATLIYRPNTWVMGRDCWTGLSSHPKLVNAIRGNVTGSGIVTPEEVTALFSGEGLKKILIGEGFVNTARRGQVATLNRVWGKSIEMYYLDSDLPAELGGVTFGWTAQFGTRIAGSWDDRNVGLEGGRMVRTGEKVEERVVAPDVGFIIQNAVA